MKKYFIPGLVLLLPLALTLFIISFIFNLLTEPFVGLFQQLFAHFHLFEAGFFIWSAAEVQVIASKILILVFLFVCTIFLGWLARWVLFSYFMSIWDLIIHKIPFVSSVYKTCQDVIHTLFTTDSQSFKQVVLVPYPTANSRCIGMITKEDIPPLPGTTMKRSVAVFIPTAPNPTSGFLILYPQEDVVLIDMPVEEAFKYVISCGMVETELHSLEKPHSNP